MSARSRRDEQALIPKEVLDEIKLEAARQNRSVGWLVRKAWQLAREELEQSPPRISPYQNHRDQER